MYLCILIWFCENRLERILGVIAWKHVGSYQTLLRFIINFGEKIKEIIRIAVKVTKMYIKLVFKDLKENNGTYWNYYHLYTF